MNDLRWNLSKTPHVGIGAALAAAHASDPGRRSEDEHHLRLYSEREWSLYLETGGARVAHRPRKRRRLSLNVVRNNVDAWQNLVCRARPHITYLTKGADWSLQKKARLRTRFVEAHFLKRKLYDKANLVAKHAGIFGGGFVQVVKEHGRIDYDVVMPGELVIDAREAQAGDPRRFYRAVRGGIDLRVLQELFPEHAKKLENAPRLGGGSEGGRVPFVHAWAIPSGPDAGDGMHVQCVPGFMTLSKKPYKWAAPPITQFRFDDAPIGWFGSGIAEELSGIQFEINSVLRTIQNNIYMGGNLKIGIPKGSTIAPSQISNALGAPTFEFTGQPPVWMSHDVVSPNLFTHLANLRREASEIIGISQMNAESQTPFASMSGRARLASDNAYSKRFVTHQGRYEQFFCDLSERTLEAAADLAEDGEDIEILFPGRTMSEVVRYSDVAGEENDFDAQAWSASLAGETPAGKLEQISEMMGLGMIDLAGAMYLFEVPHDLRAHMEMVLAPIELTMEAIGRIIEDGVPMTPTPMMDLKLAMKNSQLWYQRGVLREADTQRLHLLLDFHAMCVDMMQASMTPANANGAPPAEQVGAPAALSGVTLPPPAPAQLSA